MRSAFPPDVSRKTMDCGLHIGERKAGESDNPISPRGCVNASFVSERVCRRAGCAQGRLGRHGQTTLAPSLVRSALRSCPLPLSLKRPASIGRDGGERGERPRIGVSYLGRSTPSHATHTCQTKAQARRNSRKGRRCQQKTGETENRQGTRHTSPRGGREGRREGTGGGGG